MKNALSKAEQIAAEEGRPIDPVLRNAILSGQVPTEISGEGLHWLKIGLDAVKKDPANPLEGQMMRSVMNTSDKFGQWRARHIPEYAMAQDAYGFFSKPINRMELGQELAKKVNSALSDHGPYTRETAETFARALRDLDTTAQKATGFKGAKADQILSPVQRKALERVAEDLNRKTAADELGRGVGSNTFQNFAMNGIGEAAGIPSAVTGLLRFLPATRALMNAGQNLGGHLYAGPQREMQSMLADALLDPKRAAQIMVQAQRAQLTQGLIDKLGYLPSASAIGAVNYSQ
jgi:hypothetical protein